MPSQLSDDGSRLLLAIFRHSSAIPGEHPGNLITRDEAPHVSPELPSLDMSMPFLELKDHGFIKSTGPNSPDGDFITDAGRAEAERLLNISRKLLDENESDQRVVASNNVDSSSWTGLSRIKIDYRNAPKILKLIDAALAELSFNENSATAQARAFLIAAKELTDAPEPPSDVIWDLIQRAGAVVGLLDIFFRIFLAVIK